MGVEIHYDYNELEELRISIARIAQAVGLEDHIPGANGGSGLPYEELLRCAKQPRGWNSLCGLILDHLEGLPPGQPARERGGKE